MITTIPAMLLVLAGLLTYAGMGRCKAPSVKEVHVATYSDTFTLVEPFPHQKAGRRNKG